MAWEKFRRWVGRLWNPSGAMRGMVSVEELGIVLGHVIDDVYGCGSAGRHAGDIA